MRSTWRKLLCSRTRVHDRTPRPGRNGKRSPPVLVIQIQAKGLLRFVADTIYNTFKRDLLNGGIDPDTDTDTDTIKIMLVISAYQAAEKVRAVVGEAAK